VSAGRALAVPLHVGLHRPSVPTKLRIATYIFKKFYFGQFYRNLSILQILYNSDNNNGKFTRKATRHSVEITSVTRYTAVYCSNIFVTRVLVRKEWNFNQF
jgi:hypothetical protein